MYLCFQLSAVGDAGISSRLSVHDSEAPSARGPRAAAEPAVALGAGAVAGGVVREVWSGVSGLFQGDGGGFTQRQCLCRCGSTHRALGSDGAE